MNTPKQWLKVGLALAVVGAVPTQPANPSQPGSMMMGQGMMGQGMMGHGMMMGSMARRQQAMMEGIPEPYRSARNPLPSSSATLERGAQVYAQNCASCHGAKGYGDGPAGEQLSPRPADLSRLAHSPMAGDPYVYWTVSEGGRPVGSAMPAFKELLSPRDTWAVVAYVRQGVGVRPRR